MGDRLDGKIAIITGAARGQGEAEARRFVAEGARVVMGDLLVAEGEAVAAELGDAAVLVRHDVTSADDWASVVAAADALGGVDILVNNAGVHWVRPLEHETVDDFRRMLDINLLGAFIGMQAVLPSMRARGGGSIVNISSTAGLAGLPYHTAYGASKWALRGMSRTAAVELGPDGIRVNTVHPGPIYTDMLRLARGTFDEAERFPNVPLKRPGDPEEVAALVLFLASDESSYLTGSEYRVDGGTEAGPAPTYEWKPPAP